MVLGLLEGHVVLLGVAALVLEDLVEQVRLLAGLHGGGVLDRLVVVVLGCQLAAEDDVAGEGPADLHVDRLGRVVADPLVVQSVWSSQPTTRAVDLDLHAGLVDPPEDVGPVDLHPDVVAPGFAA